MSEELKQNTSEFTGSSEFNALHFLIQSIVKGMVNTAIPVRVDSVTRTGEGNGADYLSATPLVEMRSADGKAIPNVSIPKLRWFRLQHGTAAFICDPKPGDIGLAIFAQQDVSALSGGTEPVQPGSFRCFDMSDGFYVGGFWGAKPETFVHLEDSGHITITAPQAVTVNTTNATVNASGSVKVDTPETTITGNATIQKNLTVGGKITGSGGLAISGGGGATVSGDVVADGISLKSHTHTGDSGGTTSSPH